MSATSVVSGSTAEQTAGAELTLPAGEWISALTILEAVVPRRPLVPSLAYILMSATSEGISLSGFDYDTAATVDVVRHVGGEGRAPCTTLLNHRQLLDMVKALRRGESPKAAAEMPVTVTASVTGSGSAARTEALLTSGGWAVPLDADASASDYPLLPPLAGTLARVNGEEFVAMFSRCAQFADRDDSRPTLTGVQITFEGNSLILRATDRYRAVRGVVAADTMGIRGSMVVPAREVARLLKRLPAGEFGIGLAAGERLSLTAGAVKVTVREVMGEFVDLDKHIPPPDLAVTVPTRQLLAATEKAAALTARSDRDGGSVIGYRVTADGIAAEPLTDRGAAQAPVIAAAHQQGEPDTTVLLSAKRAVEAVRSVSSAQITLTVQFDAGRPVMFTSPSDPAGYAHVLMPTRTA